MTSRAWCAPAWLGAAILFCAQSPGQLAAADATATVYYNATVQTLEPGKRPAQAFAVRNGKLIAVGTRAQAEQAAGSGAGSVDLNGATVLPGFIDPHSHFLGYGFYADPTPWVDVSSVNLFFKPLPGDARCPDPNDYQRCFIPVRSHDDVVARIRSALAKGAKQVYAINYDVSRLGHGPSCGPDRTKTAFECPNFENGNARATLDALSHDVPIYVSSETGHISYGNTKALLSLNICGFKGSDRATCHMPFTNKEQNVPLAHKGQLNEDLALYGNGQIINQVLQKDPAVLVRALAAATDIYAGHGFTLIQEGAAGLFEARIYNDVTRADPDFPFTVALMVYDLATGNIPPAISIARQAEALIKGNDKVFIAGLKTFADGSPQGYTADLDQRYLQVFPPFTGPLFDQPYTGVSNQSLNDLKTKAIQAHRAGYPIMIHENGNQAGINTVRALEMAEAEGPKGFRDIVLHAPFIDPGLMSRIAGMGDAVSFLMGNLHFWAQPLCDQILGPNMMTRRYVPYEAQTASNLGARPTMHTDSPVNPPDPLFMVWVAKTRKMQQASWLPNVDPSRCPTVLGPEESLSIRQGIQAWTSFAAWQYGLSNSRGTITAGKRADLVVMSADPLAMENRPDDLKAIRIVGTLHAGKYRLNPNRNRPPVWPG
jgi:predicted amidohydrolase YtcJ